jgi:hypothetical protein
LLHPTCFDECDKHFYSEAPARVVQNAATAVSFLIRATAPATIPTVALTPSLRNSTSYSTCFRKIVFAVKYITSSRIGLQKGKKKKSLRQ